MRHKQALGRATKQTPATGETFSATSIASKRYVQLVERLADSTRHQRVGARRSTGLPDIEPCRVGPCSCVENGRTATPRARLSVVAISSARAILKKSIDASAFVFCNGENGDCSKSVLRRLLSRDRG